MYKNKKIAVVVPCYNEETQIKRVIETMPEYVDQIVVVDDSSKDKTVEVIENLTKADSKIKLIKEKQNRGCGGALATGYIWARDNGFDVVVRMDGDGQMDPSELKLLLDPVVSGETDYAKGNRLFTGEAFEMIPKSRYFGNAILTLLTKIASGYWHVADSQSGYTAMNKNILKTLDWRFMYTRYGQPNHLLILLNLYNFRVRDVPVKPIYGIGEKSGIKVKKVIFTISWLLFKNFLWRMKEKYFIRDFHPLIFFYFIGFVFFVLFIFLFADMVFGWVKLGHIEYISALGMMFSFMSSSLFTLFAMWFDMEANKDLK
jgi:glycosyltransferase involved in cell wall biosynthesis|tara:strand:- start:120 stop:1067 length:948 start_codon:yes stop_codon:yes gene_type:complete